MPIKRVNSITRISSWADCWLNIYIRTSMKRILISAMLSYMDFMHLGIRQVYSSRKKRISDIVLIDYSVICVYWLMV